MLYANVCKKYNESKKMLSILVITKGGGFLILNL